MSVDASEKSSMKELDGWIEELMDCKQLAESNIKILCEKVSIEKNLTYFLGVSDFYFTENWRNLIKNLLQVTNQCIDLYELSVENWQIFCKI